MPMLARHHASFVVGGLLLLMLAAEPAAAADPGAVQNGIQRGAAFLRTEIADGLGGNPPPLGESLMALALLKVDNEADRDLLTRVAGRIVEKVANGVYTPTRYHIYEAGVDVTLLADLDPASYLAEIQAIASYLIENQQEAGGWDYPTGRGTNGDTSVSQYGCLGLWAAVRSGVDVPEDVWLGAIRWHQNSQLSDGGFNYVPGTTEGKNEGAPTLSLTSAAIGSMLIAARHLMSPAQADNLLEVPQAERPSTTTLGQLEQVSLDQVRPGAAVVMPATAANDQLDVDALKESLRRAMQWMASHFSVVAENVNHPMYYYYTLERMGALSNVDRIGSHLWFDECANYVLRLQRQDGSWPNKLLNTVGIHTAFAVLFLTRSTAKIIGRQLPFDPLGGGLMAGGRGLGGGDLTNLRVDGNGIVVQSQELGPLDDMLASLSNLGDGGIDEVQRQIVEKVQIGDRDALIENKERLVELVSYQNPDEPQHAAEVRRTAVWALGRTNDLSLVRLLIEALDDVSYDVMLESRNALCWLARRPNGLGEANDPLASVPENASPDQRQAAITAWHSEAFRNWGAWYLERRPYEDRGDEFEAWLLDRMSQL